MTGHFELSDDGKALKVFEVVPFHITVDLETVVAAVNAASRSDDPPTRESEN